MIINHYLFKHLFLKPNTNNSNYEIVADPHFLNPDDLKKKWFGIF